MGTVRYRVGRRRRYRINGKRFYPLLALVTIFIVLLILNRIQEKDFYTKYRISE